MARSTKEKIKFIPVPPPFPTVAAPRIVPLFRKANTNHQLAIGILDSGITAPTAATITFVLGSKVILFEDIKIKNIVGDFIAIVGKRKFPSIVLTEDEMGVGTIVVTVVGPSGTPPVVVSGT